ncbi:MAG: ABC transporter permease subunit [Clostridia bacterium]|nr:ABC transporter permease subunit [Clostridia bacterium]
MDNKQTNTSPKKEFFLWRWAKRMVLGTHRELTAADERYDSPSKLAVKRFFRKKLATVAVILLLCLFLFVMIGPLFAPIDLSYEESLHVNVGPTTGMMKLPSAMKESPVSISSRGSFTLGLDQNGNVHTWGYYKSTSKNVKEDVMVIPEEVEKANILYAAAGKDHCLAIGDDGTVYAWGVYDNGQYGHDGTLIAACEKMPIELMNGNKVDVNNVAQLVCGNQVSALLLKDGTLYAWGNYASGALNMLSIKKLAKEENTKVTKVFFTNTNMYALTEDGKLLSGTSQNFSVVEVYDENGVRASIPFDQYAGDRKITDIVTSGDSITILFEDGELLLLGSTAKVATIPEGETVVSIQAGTRHFTVLTDAGKVYAYGNGKLGQTAVPSALTKEDSCDRIISTGFQNYAFKDGKFVESFGLKGYIMGTDELGRDVFNRVMNGGKMTMTVGAVAVIVAAIIGIIVGCLSGYFGGWVDMLLMRVTEIFGAIPFLPFALVLSAILQASDLDESTRIFIIMIVLGVLSWTGLARLVRGQILAEREKEFVLAAKAMGVKEKRIAFKHILPNIISVILVTLTLDFASCMLTESSLSYLGFGVRPPRPTWGNMLNGCRNATVIEVYWWRWLFPAIFLSIAVICINIIGDALRDVLDPKSEVEK